MPDVILGMLVLGGFVGLVIAWQKFTGMLGTKANQHIFSRSAYAEGDELVNHVIKFRAATSDEELRHALHNKVQVEPKVPMMLHDAYVLDQGPGYITYRCGNRAISHFTAVLEWKEEDGQVAGSWEIVDWTRIDGVVASISVMKRLLADMRKAILSVDPNARISG